jgi:hypothetical protein
MRGIELPEDLHHHSSRLEWIRKAIAVGALSFNGSPAMPHRQPPSDATVNPKPQDQRNHRCAQRCAYTDPDSQRIKGADGWILGCNAQAAADGDLQVIVAFGVSNQVIGVINQASDVMQLLPILERIQANTGLLPDAFIAAASYCSTLKGRNHQEDEQPTISMPAAEWIASCAPRPARRSMPCARRSLRQ